jgi:hypothetical protein
MYPVEEMEQVLKGYRDFMAGAPDEITAVAVALTFPADPEMPEVIHDREVVVVGAVYVGDAQEGLEATKPLRELGTVLFDMSGPTPYVGVQTGFDGFFPRNTLHSYWKSQYVEDLTDEAIATIAKAGQSRTSSQTMVVTFAMGGAISAVDDEATAFATRSAPWMISIDGNWTEGEDDKHVAWVRSIWSQVKEFGTGDVYLNFTGLADEAPQAGVDTAFGRNLARLAEIKAKYDPANLFRVNNNILPAG